MIKELKKVRIKLVDDGIVDSDIHVNNSTFPAQITE